MKLKKTILLMHTIRYLKVKQIVYRLFYFVRARYRRAIGFRYASFSNGLSHQLNLLDSIPSYACYKKENTFVFLNLKNHFNTIDWNYSDYGKLWTYNITYFDFLNQQDMSKKDGLKLIDDFIDKESTLKDAIEPFPISLRGINWIKFLSREKIKDKKIDHILYKHYRILLDNLEYHLLGNHLLENGFSLLFGAYYFQDEKLYAKAKEILTAELEEQILEDGAHFELSPMYHQIMLFRVLDCLNLLQNNPWTGLSEDGLMGTLKEKAVAMLGWLNAISYEDGSIPLLNDSANGIAPTTEQLNDYADRLGLTHSLIHPFTHILKESGYRKITKPNYECIIDIGHIGPDYIPGHAHADTFNFELRIDSKPFIVDTGLSTYESNDRRTKERSTSSHNTVEINETNSSEVWGAFRVANRAYVTQLEESDDSVTAIHDGYKKLGVLHTREWYFEEDKITIGDSLSKKCHAVARLHFHPDITEEEIKRRTITNHESRITNYDYAPEFNKLQKALMIEIKFEQNLKVEINL